MQNWTTIITFTLPHEAHMAKNVLESEGVETMIQDELTAQVDNFLSNAIGGVKLKVRDSDIEKGLKILETSGYISDNGKNNREIVEIVSFDLNTNTHICPFCTSQNIGKKKQVYGLTIVVFFILGAFFPIFRRSLKCFDCEKEWKFVKAKKVTNI